MGVLLMQKTLFFMLLALFIELVSGCGNAGNGATKKHSIPPTFSCRPGDSDRLLEGVSFAGRIDLGNIEVSYQHSFKTQAECIAKQISESLLYIEKSTGFRSAFNKIKVYLIEIDIIPYDVRQMFVERDNNLNMVLFVQSNDKSCEAIVAQNCIYPATFIHELVEVSLVDPVSGPSIPNDDRWKLWFLEGKILYYTRWFREGFSDYAGYLAYEQITSDINFEAGRINTAYLQNCLHLHPFSELSKVGKDLFSWHQFSSFPMDSNSPRENPNMKKTTIGYYDAAFGLFLVIRDRYGENAIREIVNGIATLEKVDGSALTKLSNRVLNSDIEELAENFHFPETGLYMEALFPYEGSLKGLSIEEGLFVMGVEQASAAEKAGIRKNDVIYRINDRDVTTSLDFEFALYEFKDEHSVEVGIWRKGDGESTVSLILDGT
jgi:hypothetical protein